MSNVLDLPSALCFRSQTNFRQSKELNTMKVGNYQQR